MLYIAAAENDQVKKYLIEFEPGGGLSKMIWRGCLRDLKLHEGENVKFKILYQKNFTNKMIKFLPV